MFRTTELENVLNACALLGLEPSCTTKEVSKAFRQLAILYHPDRNKSPQAKDKFLQINNAHDLLLQPASKALLEAYLQNKNNSFQRREFTFNFFNEHTPEAKSTSTTGNNLQSDWAFNNFSTEHDTFGFKGVSGEFKRDHINFFHYMSASPCVSFSFKYDHNFYTDIHTKINNVLHYHLWISYSVAEGALRFSLPRDNDDYNKVLSILFEEYKLPKPVLQMILNQKLKEEFIPRQHSTNAWRM